MKILNDTDSKLQKMREEVDTLLQAKQMLAEPEEGEDEVTPSAPEDSMLMKSLSPLLEETRNLKSVWSELASVDADLEGLKEIPWNHVVPKKIRAPLDEV